MQSSRNWRRRHGKHVDFLAHLLQTFFMAYPEALLFIHNQQPKIGELYVFRKQAVSSNEDIYLAGFDALQNFFLLLRRAEAAHHLDSHGERSEALLESF